MISNSSSLHSNSIVPRPARAATLHLVQTSRFAKRLARLLLVGLVGSILGMAFLPWQQTSRGKGEVVAFAPQERQQSIEARVGGVIVSVTEGLVEGSRVEKGQVILEIQPLASNRVQQLEAQKFALLAKKETAEVQAQAYGANIRDLTEVLAFTISGADQLVDAARATLRSKEELIPRYEANELQARQAFERMTGLNERGLRPDADVEKAKREWDGTIAELQSIHEEITAAELEVSAKEANREKERLLAETKIDYARAMEQEALGKVASADEDLAKIEIELKELSGLVIRAPKNGTIFRMPVYEEGMIIKAGDPILTIVPDATQNAVELFVNGNDMPLVQVGQTVRLQFEGWPAVQFTGWPSVAVGTFGGEVATVDATDNGKGQFRILVIPGDSEWPSDQYLRQGVRANGWVMLREVSLGYEIWRQLNGFPVILSSGEPSSSDDIKTPKLPK